MAETPQADPRRASGGDDEVAGCAAQSRGKEAHLVAGSRFIGLNDRSLPPWRERLKAQGHDGLAARRMGRPSENRAAPMGQWRHLLLFPKSQKPAIRGNWLSPRICKARHPATTGNWVPVT
jgi:hypothetical protein